jgi:hypothetical protein
MHRFQYRIKDDPANVKQRKTDINASVKYIHDHFVTGEMKSWMALEKPHHLCETLKEWKDKKLRYIGDLQSLVNSKYLGRRHSDTKSFRSFAHIIRSKVDEGDPAPADDKSKPTKNLPTHPITTVPKKRSKVSVK